MLKSTDDEWEIEIQGAKNPHFACSDKYLVFEKGDDSIAFLSVIQKAISQTYLGRSLQKVKRGDEDFLIWRAITENRGSELLIWSSKDDQIRNIQDAGDYFVSKNRGDIYYIRELKDGIFKLMALSLNGKREREVWSGYEKPENIIFDVSGNKLAFTTKVRQKGNEAVNIFSIDGGRIVDISNILSCYRNDLVALNRLSFSTKGDRLIFAVLENDWESEDLRLKSEVSVDVWHYQDEKLQSQQLTELSEGVGKYASMSYVFYDFQKEAIKLIGMPAEKIGDWPSIKGISDFILFSDSRQSPDELQFDPSALTRKAIYLRDLSDYSDKTVVEGRYLNSGEISPDDQYVIYYDQIKAAYYSFEISTNRTTEITKGIPYPIHNAAAGEAGRFTVPEGVGGWSKDGDKVYVYDEFDIWEIRLNGKGSAKCITGGFGRKNNVRLRFRFTSNVHCDENNITSNDVLLLHATSLIDYRESFVLGKLSEFEKIDSIDLSPAMYTSVEGTPNRFLVEKSDGVNVSNWFLSTDLKHFRSLTKISPQRRWNWYTKELIDFEMISGGRSKAIVYRPENFDSTLKYPLIFTFYQTLSDKIYQTSPPRLSKGQINAAWMSSRGYIVVEVDIPFKIGSPGESAYNAVVSAARYMAKMSWVDSTKMGLSGASFGAFSSNYIITHTGIFAAAASAFGKVDMISGYGAIRESGFSTQYLCETSQDRIGATLWERPDLYIENSPIFRANKVETPVLILHNKEDVAVPWSQGLEWFQALRRNGKRAWMLQYDNEGHGVLELQNKLDYTTRLVQFFDHFLKGKPAPIWISKGIPALQKGYTLGLDPN
jgi:dienelactone hydrolase